MHRLYPAIAIVAILAFTAATTSPTTVINAYDPTLHPYQQFSTANCTESGDCAILFPAITTGTLIQHVSCSGALTTGTTIGYASLGIQGENPRNFLQPFAYSSSGGFLEFGINADAYVLYTKGQQPRIDVFGYSPVQSLLCTVSGYYN